jgi:hypothetical protein
LYRIKDKTNRNEPEYATGLLTGGFW